MSRSIAIRGPFRQPWRAGGSFPLRRLASSATWPENQIATRLRIIPGYKDDETNTASQTVLMMQIGGGKSGGIHGAHFGPGIEIRYATADPKRQTIPWVQYRNRDTKATRTYLAQDAKPESVSNLPQFDMQCVDCHNHPTHAFELPERAVNRALASGDLSSTLRYISH